MDRLDLGLSPGFRLSVMASYAAAIRRHGAWGRLAVLAGMIVTSGLFAIPTWRLVQFLPMVAGVGLAMVETHPAILESRDGAVRRWVADHSIAQLTVAAPNLPGLLEGLGAVSAGLFLAGPAPVVMPANARLVSEVLLTGYTWNAFSNVAADPGYYNTVRPPTWWMTAARWLLPPATALVAFVIYVQVGGPTPAAVPLTRWAAAVLGLSFLLLWPYTWTLDVLLHAAEVTADNEVLGNLKSQQHIHYEYTHRAKNELRPEFQDVNSPEVFDAYSAAVVSVDNVIRDILSSDSGNYRDIHPVAELWHRYHATLAGAAIRERLTFADGTGGRLLTHMEGLILQSIFVGLVSNALRATPDGQVTVTVVDVSGVGGGSGVRVRVEDDGVGGVPETFAEGTGLGRLDALCSRYDGGVLLEERPGGGTSATAEFRYPYAVDGDLVGQARATRQEQSHGLFFHLAG